MTKFQCQIGPLEIAGSFSCLGCAEIINTFSTLRAMQAKPKLRFDCGQSSASYNFVEFHGILSVLFKHNHYESSTM